ncbi:SDR family oxidoreductase [Qaidamihabitans albus]|uniref:SDR family oxidoreductase n=1 Tax=Qaidamihabitans albus TaxID=2795733 RepID=UPI0018F19AF7|nr:SDR family oxidoreductase [Qaidamihabitans albus]
MGRNSGKALASGCVVAVTGGARGIGYSTALAFARAGAAVAIGDLAAEPTEQAAAEIAQRAGQGGTGRVIGLPLDVADADSFAKFLDRTENELGPLRILVNNAGIMPTGFFLDEDERMTERVIGVNLRGVIRGSRLAADRFVSRGEGHVINIASLAGAFPFPGVATYCAAKHAVVGFTQALHRELEGSGVDVSIVLPSLVRTELSVGANVPKWIAKVSTVYPEDVAGAVVETARTGRPLTTVPRRVAAMLTIMSILPYRARRVLEARTGAERVFAQPDVAARERYLRQLNDAI